MRKNRNHKRALLRLGSFLCLGFVAFLLSACATGGSGNIGHFTTVVVDAGHGGHDRGAKSVTGTPEKMVALDTSRRLAKVLRSKGFHVIETRTTDNFVTLGNRVSISNRTSNSIFVSVHYNWAPRSAAKGLEVYYYNPRSRVLAANINQQINKAYPTNDRGVKRNNYYVLRNNKKAAVLCELGFLSNPSDNRYAQNPMYRQRLAERIAAGVIASRSSH